MQCSMRPTPIDAAMGLVTACSEPNPPWLVEGMTNHGYHALMCPAHHDKHGTNPGQDQKYDAVSGEQLEG